jgi:hypothetical protein
VIAHFTDEAVSEYGCGRVREREIDTVFEHLLECDHCYSRQDAELTFGESMREALSRFVLETATFTPRRPARVAGAVLASSSSPCLLFVPSRVSLTCLN